MSEARRDQQALIAELDLFESERQRNLNRLEAVLSRHWPELEHILDYKLVSVLSLIGEYGSPQEVAAHRSEAQQLLQRIGRSRLDAEKVRQVLDSSATTLGIPCTEGERYLLQILGRELVRSHQRVQAIEHRITPCRIHDTNPRISSRRLLPKSRGYSPHPELDRLHLRRSLVHPLAALVTYFFALFSLGSFLKLQCNALVPLADDSQCYRSYRVQHC